MKRPRIALLRGPYLGLFEAQNYEPLLENFDVCAYILPQNLFDLTRCALPVRVCRYADSGLFGGRSLLNAWRTRLLGQRYPMPGVPAIVRGSNLVHTFEGWYTYTRQAAAACRRHNVPLVITHWDTEPYEGTLPLKERQQIARVYAVATRVLAATEAARLALLKNGVEESKILVQGMGVDSGRFSPGPRDEALAARLRIAPRDFVFLYIGRLVQDKGVRLLMDAFQRVCHGWESRNLRLLLVGDGPEAEWIHRAAQERGLQDRVIIAPSVSYMEIHPWYRLGDVFVYPSIPSRGVAEQFGYALVEAMSAGRAIITTGTGGIPDVVGDAARIVPARDLGALADAMATLLRDSDERSRLAKRARSRAVAGFSAAAVSARLGQVYRELCGS